MWSGERKNVREMCGKYGEICGNMRGKYGVISNRNAHRELEKFDARFPRETFSKVEE